MEIKQDIERPWIEVKEEPLDTDVKKDLMMDDKYDWFTDIKEDPFALPKAEPKDEDFMMDDKYDWFTVIKEDPFALPKAERKNEENEESLPYDDQLISINEQLMKKELLVHHSDLKQNCELFDNIVKSRYPMVLVEKLSSKALRTFGSQKVGDFSVSLKASGRNKHFRVHVEGGMFCIGQRKFPNLELLVEHYTKSPIYTSQRGRSYT